MVEGLAKLAVPVFMLVFFGSLYVGGWDAALAILGQPTANHFAYFTIAIVAFGAGSVWSKQEADAGNMRTIHWLSVVGFAVLFLWLNRDMLNARATAVDCILRCFASMIVWLVVVALPWAGFSKRSTSKGGTQ